MAETIKEKSMSTDIDCGGAAFPCEGGMDGGLYPDPGMSLLDYFAGQAMIGMMQGMRPYSNEWDRSASDAYKQAVAMLKARDAILTPSVKTRGD